LRWLYPVRIVLTPLALGLDIIKLPADAVAIMALPFLMAP
jgi:hypothetical protein